MSATLFRVLCFALAFSIDVRVKAADASLPTAHEPMQEPAGCLLTGDSCAIRTRAGEKYVLTLGESKVVLDAVTSIVRVSDGRIALLRGQVLVKSKAAISVGTEFGSVGGEQSEFFVWRDDKRMHAAVTSGSVAFSLRGTEEKMGLDLGEENWIGTVDTKGRATSGVPRVVALDQHLRRWGRLYAGSKTEFTKETKEFVEQWREGLTASADFHQDLANQRRLALQQEAENRARVQEQINEENRKRKALFRSKTLFN